MPICSRLFVFLLINNGRSLRREKLIDLFYEDVDPDQALNALSTNIWRLKRWIARYLQNRPVELMSTRQDVVLEGSDLSFLDISRFEGCLDQAVSDPDETLTPSKRDALQNAIASYHGPFMEGDSDDWILFERERLHCLFVRGLSKLMRGFAAEGSYEEALDCGRRILQVDPLREYVHREMMWLYAANEQRALAVRQFEICRNTLQAECGIEPLPETIEMMKAIRAGSFDRWQPETNLPRRDGPALQSL